MYKIGEFSTLSKTTIKTLRYYELTDLLLPSHVDKNNNYRYYDTNKLIELSKIISLKQIGLSINDIRKIIKNNDNNKKEILLKRKKDLNLLIELSKNQLSRINNILEEKEMEKEVILKKLPNYTVYYKEGILNDFSEITNFILTSGKECKELNPNIKCIEPDYCYVSYLDQEYKEKNIKIRYSQAVNKKGISNDNIKFETLKQVEAACIYHKGSYNSIRDTYSYILKWIEDNGYTIIEPIRERYIDGIWNKENKNDWLTEIQIPIKK